MTEVLSGASVVLAVITFFWGCIEPLLLALLK